MSRVSCSFPSHQISSQILWHPAQSEMYHVLSQSLLWVPMQFFLHNSQISRWHWSRFRSHQCCHTSLQDLEIGPRSIMHLMVSSILVLCNIQSLSWRQQRTLQAILWQPLQSPTFVISVSWPRDPVHSSFRICLVFRCPVDIQQRIWVISGWNKRTHPKLSFVLMHC